MESTSNPAAINAVLDLGGPQNLFQLDVVKIYEEVLDRKIEVEYIPFETLHSQFYGSSDPIQKSFSGLMMFVLNVECIDVNGVQEKLPVQLNSVQNYVNVMAKNNV